MESPEINSCTYDPLIYDKRGKTIKWREDTLFNKWYWENQTDTHKETKLGHSVTLSTIINSKFIKDLNVRPEIIKLWEENIGRTLSDINCSNIFFIPSLRLMEIKINK